MKVAIFENGKRLYKNLTDNGDEVMRFDSGHGFITKTQCKENRWEIRPE